MALPAWRALLEARWQRRLAAVIRLSVAYHDASDRLGEGRRAGAGGERSQVRRLMREAVAARRALSDTEEALARLSAGNYGRCEQCGAPIPLDELVAEPEARYCRGCVRQPSGGEMARWRG
jgi:RNA polymerase-binding transcription factor DksA